MSGMKRSNLKYIMISIIAAVSAFWGLWLGEHESGPLPMKSILTLIVIIVMTILALLGNKWKIKFFMVLSITVIFIFLWCYGNNESHDAYNECIEKGENVRIALSEYFKKHHEYPEQLGQLQIQLPGKLIFPPHTLYYSKTKTGYSLFFSDWLVSHESDETHGFSPHK